MGRVNDKGLKPAETATQPPGRVEIDSRGHNVWRWARDVIESTSVLLKRLENKDLALESTQKVPVVPGPDAGAKGQKSAAKPSMAKKAAKHPALPPDHGRDRTGGFDPYNSR